MANLMKSKARQNHATPGVYSREVEVSYSVKSLGETKMGLVGETLRGRAFEPYKVADWTAFKTEFGGLSPVLYPGSQYPRYELPYIAKSYLEKSQELTVCRVLGLSGYNAGPAWMLTASNGSENGKKYVVAVFRARGDYEKSIMFNKGASSAEACACQYTAYDTLVYDAGEKTEGITDCKGATKYDEKAVFLAPYVNVNDFGNECSEYGLSRSSCPTGETAICFLNDNNYGQFTIVINHRSGVEKRYAVSLNPSAPNYILNVLGTSPETGEAPIFVEALYDVNLLNMILDGTVNQIDKDLAFAQVYNPAEYSVLESAFDFVGMSESNLRKSQVGVRYLFAGDYVEEGAVTVHPYNINTKRPIVCQKVMSGDEFIFDYEDGDMSLQFKKSDSGDSAYTLTFVSSGASEELSSANTFVDENTGIVYCTPEEGRIYTVRQFTVNGKRSYFYSFFVNLGSDAAKDIEGDALECAIDKLSLQNEDGDPDDIRRQVVKLSDGYYYRLYEGKVARVTLDLNNYKSKYRHAITPWFVSELKGEDPVEVNKLFRFHTISDGSNSNKEIKVSIANVMPDAGTFDVIIRDINDADENPVILERYRNCTMAPGDANYIGYKIGTIDGVNVQKSAYVSVEVIESDATRMSVPCGFLGYPTKIYSGLPVAGKVEKGLESLDVVYNTVYDEDLKERKQYFGLSDLTGVDIDLFTFKGRHIYGEEPTYLGNGFHLDCRAGSEVYNQENPGSEDKIGVSVDGETGYTFTTVSVNSRTRKLDGMPAIGSETAMEGSIYENPGARKFTAYFCGGFDGWDIYRDLRTTGDDYKMSKYKGVINNTNGEGKTFERITVGAGTSNAEVGISSDYYAFLEGVKKFDNKFGMPINVFATPGIDYVNDGELVKEIGEIIEDERQDLLYIVTTPDKPKGVSDANPEDFFTPQEMVDNLDESDINTSWMATYAPWVQYHDEGNNRYIWLSPTKDVVRDLADTDNIYKPWYAIAGFHRGSVECEKVRMPLHRKDSDILYAGRINPILTFKNEGPKLFGNKTLLIGDEDTQLTRIHVRRLMIKLREMCDQASYEVLFDPNDPTCQDTFESLVRPILDSVKSNRGISDYFFKVEESNGTVSDRRELNGKIYIKPYQALEFINLDYVLTPEGVSFKEL